MIPLQARFERWREYDRISEGSLIARRAFANNSFDGVLTMVGVVMGSFVAGVQDLSVVLVTGLSTVVAIGVSGGWGAWLTESAERSAAMDELEEVTLTDLRDSKIGKAARLAVVMVAATDGLSPFLSAMLVLIPFFLAPLLPSVNSVYYAALGMALLALFGLGLYLGRISRRNLILSGIKTTIAGLICLALSYALERVAG